MPSPFQPAGPIPLFSAVIGASSWRTRRSGVGHMTGEIIKAVRPRPEIGVLRLLIDGRLHNPAMVLDQLAAAPASGAAANGRRATRTPPEAAVAAALQPDSADDDAELADPLDIAAMATGLRRVLDDAAQADQLRYRGLQHPPSIS